MNRPTFDTENELMCQGYSLVAGIDEVGRGAIAGPVVAGAVILPMGFEVPWLCKVRDSKQLSPRQRETLFELMTASRLFAAVGIVSHTSIDESGIVKATKMAMREAVSQLAVRPDYLLIDALSLPEVGLPHRGIVRGDQLCLSIACASIIAKVVRDRYMMELDYCYPGYGLACHKGYATSRHLESVQRLGLSPIHRRSFAPNRRLF